MTNPIIVDSNVGEETKEQLTQQASTPPTSESSPEPGEMIKDDQLQHIKGVIEALLFVNENPITQEQFQKVLPTVRISEIKKVIDALREDYAQRGSGIEIMPIAGGYQMLSSRLFASTIRAFYKTKHKEKLSKPALESLAIIAYKQPVTRAEIELIRGINSDGIVVHLLSKELIKIVGKKDVPGKPFLYGTSKQFMEYFGLKSLDDLPKLAEFPNLQPAYEREERKEESPRP